MVASAEAASEYARKNSIAQYEMEYTWSSLNAAEKAEIVDTVAAALLEKDTTQATFLT